MPTLTLEQALKQVQDNPNGTNDAPAKAVLAEEATRFAAHCETHRVIVRPFADAAGGVRVSIGSPEENDQFLAAAGSYPG